MNFLPVKSQVFQLHFISHPTGIWLKGSKIMNVFQLPLFVSTVWMWQFLSILKQYYQLSSRLVGRRIGISGTPSGAGAGAVTSNTCHARRTHQEKNGIFMGRRASMEIEIKREERKEQRFFVTLTLHFLILRGCEEGMKVRRPGE